MSGETPRIGDYEVISLLGAGGMGRVYKVRNVITDRIEAMKVLLPEIAGREEIAAALEEVHQAVLLRRGAQSG